MSMLQGDSTSAPLSPSSSITSKASDPMPDCIEELEFDFGVYKGEVDPLSGLRHGHGELQYNNGNLYRGAWQHGAPHGYGEKVYTNGDVYRGAWSHGTRCGPGGYLYADGHLFEGHYAKDQPHGYGVLHTVQGDTYAGEWRMGRKHGVGKETLRDGQCFYGAWRNGRKEGKGVLRLPGAPQPIHGVWRAGHYVKEMAGGGDQLDAEGEAGLGMEGDGESLSERFGFTEISNAMTREAFGGLDALEMRLEALEAAMEAAGMGGGGEEDVRAETAENENDSDTTEDGKRAEEGQ